MTIDDSDEVMRIVPHGGDTVLEIRRATRKPSGAETMSRFVSRFCRDSL